MLELSTLAKTWILDVDGTIVKHNGYLIDGFDTMLDGAKEFFENLPKDDVVILLTARKEQYLDDLKHFLSKHNIRYDYIISDIPMGERILVNDDKPSGLKTAYAVNKKRDDKFCVEYVLNKEL